MKYNINLIKKQGRGLFQTVLFFFSNYLRYILVFTQLIVIGTLFFRFQIDQSIIDLKESIEQKKEIVNAASSIITEIEKVEAKTSRIETLLDDQSKIVEMLEYSLSVFPSDFFLSKLEVDGNSIKMIGQTSNINQLRQFQNLIQKQGRFTTAGFDDIRKSGSDFTFTITLNNFKRAPKL